jgi:hypothetical protein
MSVKAREFGGVGQSKSEGEVVPQERRAVQRRTSSAFPQASLSQGYASRAVQHKALGHSGAYCKRSRWAWRRRRSKPSIVEQRRARLAQRRSTNTWPSASDCSSPVTPRPATGSCGRSKEAERAIEGAWIRHFGALRPKGPTPAVRSDNGLIFQSRRLRAQQQTMAWLQGSTTEMLCEPTCEGSCIVDFKQRPEGPCGPKQSLSQCLHFLRDSLRHR